MIKIIIKFCLQLRTFGSDHKQTYVKYSIATIFIGDRNSPLFESGSGNGVSLPLDFQKVSFEGSLRAFGWEGIIVPLDWHFVVYPGETSSTLASSTPAPTG